MERQSDRLSAGAELCFLSLPTQDRTLNSSISHGVKVSTIQYNSTHPITFLLPRAATRRVPLDNHIHTALSLSMTGSLQL